MVFISSMAPVWGETKPGWWFVFRGNKLLVKLLKDEATVPLVGDPGELNLRPLCKQYLGSLNGLPSYSAKVPDDAIAPEGMTFEGLRGLFGLLSEDLYGIAGRASQVVTWEYTHQYCGQCGCPTENKQDELAKVCPECGLINYPSAFPAIIVAVIKDSLILLARAQRFTKGFYSVLAGFVEPGETLEECVIREIKEEVGIAVTNIRYFGSQSWPFPNSLMIGFTAGYAGGEIVIDKREIVDAKWFSPTNLPPMPGKVSIARQLIDRFVQENPIAIE